MSAKRKALSATFMYRGVSRVDTMNVSEAQGFRPIVEEARANICIANCWKNSKLLVYLPSRIVSRQLAPIFYLQKDPELIQVVRRSGRYTTR